VRRASIRNVAVAAVAVWMIASIAACTDVHDYRGAWSGARVGDAPALHVGVADAATAQLAIDSIDKHGMSGTLTVDGLVDHASLESLAGAEADALAQLTFTGDPLRVYLAFADTSDGAGDVLVVIALFDQTRVELRVLRGGATPIYAIFALAAVPG
jgi:hypothetical protein